MSFLGVGTCTVDANQIAGTNWNAAPQAQQGFFVAKGFPTITFSSTAPVAAVVGGSTYTVTANSPSPATITFSIDASASTVCSIAGNVVSFLAVGTCTVDANQIAGTNWNAAPQAQQSFGVGKGTPTITFSSTAPVAAVVGGSTYTVTANSPSPATITFSIDASASTVCSIAGNVVSFLAVGTCTVDANQIAGTNWNAAPQAQQSFAVGKGSQTVAFTTTAPSSAVVGGATYTPGASATSGLTAAITLDASSTGCSFSAGVVSFIGVGTCKIDANQAGNANWNAATQVQQSFAVGKGSPIITFTTTAPGAAVVGGATYTVAATSPSPAAIVLSVDSSATAVCSINASRVVSFTSVGTCKIDADQVANANWNAAPRAQQSFAVAPALPGPPTAVTATKGNASAVISWTAPVNNGGSAITSYTATSAPLGRTCSPVLPGPLTCTVTGLTNGSPYTFTVTAHNAAGNSVPSAASSAVTPSTVPVAPTGVSGVAAKGSITVSWTVPANGGSAITSFTATSTPDSKTCTATGASATSCKVTGLTGGRTYTFWVVATNANGPSAASAASSGIVALALTVPGAPTAVVGVGMDAAAVVSWTAPVDDGGSTITGYTVTSTPSSKTCTTTGALTCKVVGLSNHTPYTFKVTAANATGTSPASSASATVIPRAGDTFFALTPSRILDTKVALGLATPLSANVAATFQVTGKFPSDPTKNVPTNAVGVTGVLSVSGATSVGWVALTSVANNAPAAASINLNFPAGDARATGVTVPLGSGGKLSITYGGAVTGRTVQVAFDVTGYFVAGTSGATYLTLTPSRILDSRGTVGGMSGGLTAGTHRTFVVTGRNPSDPTKNVPTSALAVTGTLTVTGQTQPGSVSIGPLALDAPPTATVYFPVGDTRSTSVTVKLGAGGILSVTYTATAGATANVIFDVTGFFINGTAGAMWVPVAPARILDTRSGAHIGLPGSLRANVGVSFAVTGHGGVPSGAVAATGTLTAINQTAVGYLTLTKTVTNAPSTSTLNFPTGDIRNTGVTVPLGTNGILGIVYVAPSGKITDALFDVTGYFVL